MFQLSGFDYLPSVSRGRNDHASRETLHSDAKAQD